MKIAKISLLFSILLILIFSMSAVLAEDINNDTIATSDLNEDDSDILELSTSTNEIMEESSKTIVVPFDPKNPNEVLLPKIQPAINSANAGDTIVIEGNPVHCHLTINKKLNIIAGEGTTIDACPHHTHEGLEEHGVFYVTKDGSGSVIKGFTFVNKDKAETPFAILIDGASDVTINECTMNYTNPDVDNSVGIIIKNSNNIKLSNLVVRNTINGIVIINSTNVEISNCIIDNNENQAISVSSESKNINIHDNYITNNFNFGINLSSVNNVNILNNIIQNNGINNYDSGSGIYVNANITKLVVKGNIFLSNGLHAIMYDYRTRNLNNDPGAELLTIVDDNYFEGHDSMILHHRIYVEHDNGNMIYDAEKDIFIPSGAGNYVEGKSYVYLQNAFIFQDTPCGFTYYTNTIPWSLSAPANGGKYDLSLKLSEIKELQRGIYSISIVDSSGNVANDFSSGYMIFFLNDCYSVEPQQGEIYKKAPIKNGVATVDFRDIYNSFKNSSNIITAVFQGLSPKIENNPFKIFNVSDSNIPNYSDLIDNSKSKTVLISQSLTTYPLSDSYISAKLLDNNNHAVVGKVISFKFNNKIFNAKTDKNGIAKVKVVLTSKKTYSVTISFSGDDKYESSQISSKILIKSGSKKSKIKASNMKIKANKKKTFKFKLTTSAGKALKKQKVIVKVNGKKYTVKTNNNGIAKVSVKFKKVKKYKISMVFLGNSMYKGVSKTNIISITEK